MQKHFTFYILCLVGIRNARRSSERGKVYHCYQGSWSFFTLDFHRQRIKKVLPEIIILNYLAIYRLFLVEEVLGHGVKFILFLSWFLCREVVSPWFANGIMRMRVLKSRFILTLIIQDSYIYLHSSGIEWMCMIE